MPLPEQIRTAALFAATGASFYLCWLIARPFWAVITWAVALAVVAYPWHRWLSRRMHRNAAALLSVISVAIVLLVPLVVLAQKLFQEASQGLQSLGPVLSVAEVKAKLEGYPLLARIAEWFDVTLNLDEEVRRAAGAVAAKASAFLGNSVWLITQLFLTIVTLFYFFRDGQRLLDSLRRLIPLSDSETSAIFDRVSRTINTCLYSSVIVKLAQGLAGGVMFWILGLPAPVFFGAAMALLAALPFVGTALVWGPAAIYLASSGSWGRAVVLAIWGMLVVGLIDNVLYPILVAGELPFHPLAVFFSILGGLIAFGLPGLVLGPVILVVTTALLDVWRIRKERDTSSTIEVP
ncbi:MAG: AI-2E family transporter [Acidobacteriia bacterium]|nr:AI-2E family transporter [Terriglobia bacterium]